MDRLMGDLPVGQISRGCAKLVQLYGRGLPLRDAIVEQIPRFDSTPPACDKGLPFNFDRPTRNSFNVSS
jgi:hypothetical protein